MPRKVKLKYHYLYKTTNLVNGKYYIGVHSTYEIKDGYLGSGTKLWNSIYKYGKENFVKEELEFFETREELLQREKEIVNEQLLNDPLCMNLQLGGGGGFCNEKHKKDFQKAGSLASAKSGKSKKKLKYLAKNDRKWLEKFKKNVSDSLQGCQSFLGKTHTEQTKKKIGLANSKALKGKSFNLIWIYNEELKESKRIKKEFLKDFLSQNWIEGRKIKF